MVNSNQLVCLTFMAISAMTCQPRVASAGPFIDWLFGGRRQPPAYAVGPAYAYGTNPVGTYYGAAMPIVGANGYAYPHQAPGGVASAALAQPTVAYLPDYRSTYYRAPVTYYRPILTTDPTTGAQVVSLAPCTSYEYQTQRVPTWGMQPSYGWYGAAPMAAPQMQRSPLSSLPNGGIPLATLPQQSGYAMGYPSYLQHPSAYAGAVPYGTGYGTYGNYSSGYGAYSALQPSAAIPMGSYPTSPYGSGGYYGATSGGCTGSFAPSPTIPGTIAPNPNYVMPPNTIDPATQMQPQVHGPIPSSSPAPSNSPGASEVPTLPVQPQSSATPQTSARFESPRQFPVVRQPVSGTERRAEATTQGQAPTSPWMEPIPIPEELKQVPRWNPGLLKESDQTAQLTPETSDHQHAEQLWGSKKIQWASFTHPAESSRAANSNEAPNTANVVVAAAAESPVKAEQLFLRPEEPMQNTTSAGAPVVRRSIGGWKPAK